MNCPRDIYSQNTYSLARKRKTLTFFPNICDQINSNDTHQQQRNHHYPHHQRQAHSNSFLRTNNGDNSNRPTNRNSWPTLTR
ncbi:hypothetical protein BCR41DRAFT_351653 [Lobosporangium transversale]|uniref:Uncharacterized protein n=1 Tax=Lobosporangium transversale TaxID=64571 RepID=A0A1Y2GSS7_9FUNG|nr:hypothetical protein BCR41DRAFT_351653 [Lobosporangium transversale]ORZ19162.1 hypothetical protein BCR41DRAFT_351653 [Lobosporangium transversale]|eukprot:XP_021882330.1 hypothetical protein BCR41DRAFT_351653 [Lobosporangium transversale]